MDLRLSASDVLELKKIQCNVVGTPGYVKVTCVLMFAQGLSVQVISHSLGIDSSTVYCYLNRIGFTYKKTKEVPCEADAAKQKQFVKELSAILQQKDASSVVYYADGVHPAHNSRSTSDNTRYYRNKELAEWVRETKIKQIF